MVLMIGSGAMLWLEEISLRFVPKYAIDIAGEVHSDEALLATLAIIIWHFYNVHFNPDKFPMNRTWLTGRITKEEMLHEHPLEYEELMAARLRDRSSVEAVSAEDLHPAPRPEEGRIETDKGGGAPR
jgi:hypothetical protein